MQESITEFGDVVISGSCATLDGSTAVPIYEFTPDKDGAYNLEMLVLAWHIGSGGAQYYFSLNWVRNGGVLTIDSSLFPGILCGSLEPEELTADVDGGKARVLVKGLAGRPLLWRMKGVLQRVTV